MKFFTSKAAAATRRITAVLAALTAVACGNNPQEERQVDPDAYAIPELGQPIEAFTGTCAFVVAGGGMTVTFTNGAAAAATAILSKRTVDSAILVNGYPCYSADAVPVLAVASKVKTITVTGGAGDDTLIVDYANGAFAPGTATVVGMPVDLGAGTNSFKFRGQKTADTVTLGAGGFALSTTNKDVTVSLVGPPELVFALSDGNDVFSTGGSAGTGATFAGAVQVFGGLGNDTFNEGAAQNGATEFNGGPGSDTVSYALRTAALDVSLDDTANDGDPAAAGELDNIKDDVEVVTTGSGADTLASGANAVTFNAGAGDDTFDEGSAATPSSVFNGGAGVDTVDYSARVNALVIIMGAGAADGESGENDDFKADVERVVGGDGNDTITGSANADIMFGGAGNDILNGAAGDDIFEMDTADDGSDTIIGGAGLDLADYSLRTGNLTVDMVGTSASADADDGESGEGDDIRDDVENLTGGDGDDSITGNALNNELAGGDGNDTLSGGAGDDVLEGGAATGAQALTCGAGDDIAISTDAVNDTVAADCEL